MVKIREGINHCSLADLYDLLRTHESDLHGLPGGVLGDKEIGGPMAFVSRDSGIAQGGGDLSEEDSGGDICMFVNGKKCRIEIQYDKAMYAE